MHLLPADRAGHRVIDSERVCHAIASLGDPESVRTQAQHYAVLADPTRLTLLTCIGAAGPISVSDLAAATGLLDTTVSQALRYLRAAHIVSTQRDGRVIRYLLADHPVRTLLASRQVPPALLPRCWRASRGTARHRSVRFPGAARCTSHRPPVNPSCTRQAIGCSGLAGGGSGPPLS